MKVRVAKTAGFCFGVERAVNTVYEEIDKGSGPIYTFGPIIHNESVVSDLRDRGVEVINSEEELSELSGGTVIIRSHGVPARIYDLLESRGIRYVDCTCPFVKKIHRIVSEESEKGEYIVVVGDPDHPEVQGLCGWCKGSDIAVISDISGVKDLPVDKEKKICIVSQTTFNYKKFQEIVELIRKKGYDIIVFNTICNATQERQQEASDLASCSDAMIVIGGKNSSNTQKLYKICSEKCANTYYIQTLDDLELRQLELFKNVGITAGASTPKNIIEEVQKNVRRDEL